MTVESFRVKHREADALLAQLCAEWRNELATAEAVNAEAGEQIRAAIGQAELLMRKKMAKVRGRHDVYGQDCVNLDPASSRPRAHVGASFIPPSVCRPV
jgi:hypothetical protein